MSLYNSTWQITDEKGVLLTGSPAEMILAWHVNFYTDSGLIEIYGHANRNPKWIIKEWTGKIRLVNVYDELGYELGLNKTKHSSSPTPNIQELKKEED